MEEGVGVASVVEASSEVGGEAADGESSGTAEAEGIDQASMATETTVSSLKWEVRSMDSTTWRKNPPGSDRVYTNCTLAARDPQ